MNDSPAAGKKFWTLGAFTAVATLFAFLFPVLCVFQSVRSLHYDIIREKVAWECPACAGTLGTIRTFGGFPQEQAQEDHKSKSWDMQAPTYYRAWCHDLPQAAARYDLRIGEKEFHGDCSSRVAAFPGDRFVYFIFISRLNSDVAWQNAGLRPNLILVNWGDVRGFWLSALSLRNILSALFSAFFLVLSVRYLTLNFRRVFAFRIALPPAPRYYYIMTGAALLCVLLYFIPLFHNIVLFFYALVFLAALIVRRLFLKPSPAPTRPFPVRPAHVAVLSVILVGSLWLRVHKADWGFPLLMHTDEYAVTSFPPQMSAKNSLDPIDFEHPNHASIYANSILYGIASEILFHQPLHETFAGHENFYHLLSRVFVGCLGALSVLVAFLVGAEFHPRIGLVAALLFALYPQYIDYAHDATPDISLTLLIEGMMLFSIRYLKRPSAADLFYACACAAVASSEKYPGLLSLFGIASAVVAAHRADKDALKLSLARAGLLYLALLFFAAPFVILKPHLVLLNIISESRPTHPGADGLSPLGNALYYIRILALRGSLLLELLALGGFGVVLARHRKLSLPLFLGLFYWIVLSLLPLHWERWGLPMFVTPLLFAAFAIDALWRRSLAAAGPLRYLGVTVTVALLMVVTANFALKTVVVLSELEAKNTCLIGQDIFREKGLTEDNTLAGHYTPLSPTWKRGFDFIISYRDPDIMKGKEYAAVASGLYERYYREPEKYPEEIRFYDSLFTLPLVIDVKPEPMKERFASVSDLENLARAWPGLKDYWERRGRLSFGSEIRVYRLGAVPQATHL